MQTFTKAIGLLSLEQIKGSFRNADGNQAPKTEPKSEKKLL
jgi:hypothetical protein